jgi:PAS domain-containing protein
MRPTRLILSGLGPQIAPLCGGLARLVYPSAASGTRPGNSFDARLPLPLAAMAPGLLLAFYSLWTEAQTMWHERVIDSSEATGLAETAAQAQVESFAQPPSVGRFSAPAAALPDPTEMPTRRRPGASLVAAESGLLQRCVAESAHICFVAVAPDGRVRAVNLAIAAQLGYAPRTLAERDIWSLLTDADAAHLRRCALHGWMPAPEPLLLTFVKADGSHFTLRCLVDIDPDGLVVVGEPAHAEAA